MSTVSYGDLAPRTAAGRTFAIFFTLFVIGLAGYALSTAAAIVFEGHCAKMALKRLENRMKKNFNLIQSTPRLFSVQGIWRDGWGMRN